MGMGETSPFLKEEVTNEIHAENQVEILPDSSPEPIEQEGPVNPEPPHEAAEVEPGPADKFYVEVDELLK